MKLKERAEKLKSDIPAVFIALKDAETPVIAKITAALTVGYALSPVDLIPDFIPVLGCLDDIIILPALVALTIRLVPDAVWRRSRAKAENLWKDGKPVRWYFAVPFIAVWLLVLWLIIRAVMNFM